MKLTRSAQAKGAEFFRDLHKGKLIHESSPHIDKTTEIINNLPNTTSFIGRILLHPAHPKEKDPKKRNNNKFNSFVSELVCNRNNDKLSTFLPQLNKNETVEFVINKSLSFYGKNLKYNKDGLTLKELLYNHYNGQNIDNELSSLHDYIQTLIDYKTEKLSKSISKNIIPFTVENKVLKPQTPKMEFLFKLLKNNGVDKSVFDEFKSKYAYSNLEDEIKTYITQTFDAGNKLSCKKIYDMLVAYNHNFYKSNETDDNIKAFVFFSNEIRNHFRTYFPIKEKNEYKSKRLSNLNEKNAIYFCSEKFVFTQVWKHIVNQLVQGLILYGKLQHYYYDGSQWQTNKLNSNGLSEIQIEESFKKQIFLSLCWGATRLNYFYNFGSQNITAFAPDSTQKYDRDIFLDKDTRETFYNKIKSDINQFEKLKNKMTTCYPLEDNITNEEVSLLLEDIVQSCYAIRNHVFHYNEITLFKVIKEKSKEKLGQNSITQTIIDNLLQKDIDSIETQFKEQIRSSCIADYYSLDTLKEVFKSNKLSFYLYAQQYSMMPSFKNVFIRGCNITKGNFNPKECEWFKDKDTYNKDAYLAYKNLLQLIYYHSFLPSVSSDETIITKYINETKAWNQKIAIAKQKGKINKYQYKYNDMPNYQIGIKLSDYLSNLQRLQSIRENDDNIAEKGNYYTDFVKDVFVFAFNGYLQSKIPNLCGTVKSPCKQNSKTILDDLFVDANLSLKMKTGHNKLSEFAGMYLFLKLLDQRELNKLLHQFIRYRTSTNKINEDLSKVEELIALVQFTLPPPTTDENYNENLEDYFSKFIDGNYMTDYVDLYSQEDKKTPILQRSISLIGRSGAMALYTDIFTQQVKSYTVIKSDCEKYLNSRLIIEEKQNELQVLHKEIVTAKKDADIKEKVSKYETLVKEVQEYNQCRQKVTFETLYKVHQIHIDILGRFASFAEDWERDMFFMLTALKSLGKISLDVNKVFEEGGVVGKLSDALKTSKTLFCHLCWADDSVNERDIKFKIRVRNILAHLNHMTQYNKKGNQPSIIDIINKLRALLAYDLKRQNAVTKSIQDLLLKDYKIKLVLEPVKTKEEPKVFKIKSLDSDNIVHLKNVDSANSKKGIAIEANNTFMIELIKKLLVFKY